MVSLSEDGLFFQRVTASWLIVASCLQVSFGVEEVPILYPEREILASEFLDDATTYSGQLVVSESFLELFEAWDPDRQSLAGRVRVLDRLSLEEVGMISLAGFQSVSEWRFKIALEGDRLAVINEGAVDLKAAQVIRRKLKDHGINESWTTLRENPGNRSESPPLSNSGTEKPCTSAKRLARKKNSGRSTKNWGYPPSPAASSE